MKHLLTPKVKLALLISIGVIMFSSCKKEKTLSTAKMPFAAIDSVVQGVVDTAKFNGNVLVAKDGKIIYQRSIGLANYDTHALLNDSSVFELASVSKQFTAMAIMMLKEQGKLSYDDEIRKYLPEIRYKGITIRHFLTHTSGIPDYMAEFERYGYPPHIAFNDDIIILLKKNKPATHFPPGKGWEYSNTAYALLASIIERVSGKAYGDFLAANIFEPLEMHHTRIYNTRRTKKDIIRNYAYGFVYSDKLRRYVPPDSLQEFSFVIKLDGIQGDGVVNSTTGDLFKWDQALYTEKLVKKTTLEEAFTSVVANDTTRNYGFGWGITQDPLNGKVVRHSGGWPGYATHIRRFIDHNDCIIVLTNNDGAGLGSLCDALSKKLGTL
ncbi:MAG TPA: serine hydrolase domain-containing protein [Chryseolinea sp.]|nr:serine hydrolase domain-containing protein [Chryseolinea sp.]